MLLSFILNFIADSSNTTGPVVIGAGAVGGAGATAAGVNRFINSQARNVLKGASPYLSNLSTLPQLLATNPGAQEIARHVGMHLVREGPELAAAATSTLAAAFKPAAPKPTIGATLGQRRAEKSLVKNGAPPDLASLIAKVGAQR